MPRLFFAVRTPDAIRAELTRAQSEIAATLDQLNAHYKRENLQHSHCTLRFLGNLSSEVVQPLIASAGEHIAQSGIKAFEVSASELGTFSHRGKARVIWAGLTPEDKLQSLQHSIDRCLRSLGIDVEGEQLFHPHLTLIRFKEPTRLPETFAFPRLRVVSGRIAEAELVESKTLPHGAQHTVLARFPL